MKDKYHHELSYTYINYRGWLEFTSNNKVLTKTDLLKIKESIKEYMNNKGKGDLIIGNILTFLNK